MAPDGSGVPGQNSARTAAREQALAQLDDPDRLARIGALEDILNSQDAILIDFALRKVLVSTDQEMKSTALRKLIANPKRAFVFTIESCGATLGWSEQAMADMCRNHANLLSGAVPLYFDNVDQATGQFMVHSSYSRVASPGKVQGTSLNFAIDLASRASQDCFGRTSLTADGALVGALSCSGLIFSGRIDLF